MPNKENKLDLPDEMVIDAEVQQLKTKTKDIIDRMGKEIARHKKVVHDIEAELDDVQKEMFKLIGGDY